MLRTTCPNISVILFPGRFQPPHKGHFRIIKEAMAKYPLAKIIVDMDNREKDINNPYDYECRREIFIKEFPGIEVRKHNTSQCLKMEDYLNLINSNNINLILIGPDYPVEAENYWISRGIKIMKTPERYYNISGTKIRNRNISVITNFGCNANCWYCIWKGHELEHINEPTDWNKLEKFLYNNRNKGKVSVSGGGDCLYKYDKHVDWWIKFFEITLNLNMLIDIHTRKKFTHQSFWRKHINRCVFSSDKLNQDEKYLRYLSQLTKIRIIHLVTANTTIGMINDYLKFQKEIECQLTIKELVGYSDNGMYQKIKKEYPNIYSLDKGDYNIYYMPDNSIRTTFL